MTPFPDMPASGMMEPVAWRCFHCDEVFSDEYAAREHFGEYENQTPACQIKGSEKGLLGALRESENDAADAWHAVLAESTDAAKAYFSQNHRHQRQLREVEQIGYERGLADAKAHPEELGLYAIPPDYAKRVAELEAERDELEAELNDWRNGDARGVALHMHAFHDRAESAEAQITALRSLVTGLSVTDAELLRIRNGAEHQTTSAISGRMLSMLVDHIREIRSRLNEAVKP